MCKNVSMAYYDIVICFACMLGLRTKCSICIDPDKKAAFFSQVPVSFSISVWNYKNFRKIYSCGYPCCSRVRMAFYPGEKVWRGGPGMPIATSSS
jgi:hypothetical protein